MHLAYETLMVRRSCPLVSEITHREAPPVKLNKCLRKSNIHQYVVNLFQLNKKITVGDHSCTLPASQPDPVIYLSNFI
jgi:hypothetical protein